MRLFNHKKRSFSAPSGIIPVFPHACLALFIFYATALPSSTATAFEMGAGFVAIEEGDDRTRPGAALHFGWTDKYYSRAYIYGRTFGPVAERTTLISFARRFPILKTKSLTAAVGGCLMDEAYSIDFEDSAEFDRKEHNYNVGLVAGLSWEVAGKMPLYMGAGWDSHIFPAGQGGLLLSYGRKQTISFALGYRL